MTKAVKKRNTQRSKVRARVEHVFGTMQTSMGGIFTRTRNRVTTTIKIGLINLTYNLLRITALNPEVRLVA